MALNTTAGRLGRTWRKNAPRKRRRTLLAVAMSLAFAVQLPVWLWVVDDDAIRFTHARNLGDGEGFVAQPPLVAVLLGLALLSPAPMALGWWPPARRPERRWVSSPRPPAPAS